MALGPGEVNAGGAHPHDLPLLVADVMSYPVVVGAVCQLVVELCGAALSLLASHVWTIPLAAWAPTLPVPAIARPDCPGSEPRLRSNQKLCL